MVSIFSSQSKFDLGVSIESVRQKQQIILPNLNRMDVYVQSVQLILRNLGINASIQFCVSMHERVCVSDFLLMMEATD